LPRRRRIGISSGPGYRTRLIELRIHNKPGLCVGGLPVGKVGMGFQKKLLATVLFSYRRVYIYKTYILHVEEFNK